MRTTDTDKQPSQPFGERRPCPDEQPKATPAPTTHNGIQTGADGRKQIVGQQPPMHITDMDMIRKDIGDVPVPWYLHPGGEG